MTFDDAVNRYVDIVDLAGEEAEIVRTHALVVLSTRDSGSDLTRERDLTRWHLDWRHATPLRAIRFLRRRIADEDLWMELAVARADEALILTHVKHARTLVELLDEETPAPRRVSVYLDRREVPAARARNVYQRTPAPLAQSYLPRLDAMSAEHLSASCGISLLAFSGNS